VNVVEAEAPPAVNSTCPTPVSRGRYTFIQ
jgi:hypothetical protein